MEKNKIMLLASSLLILFLISVVSAQTLIAGKIYNKDFSGTLSGADVKVMCNGNQLDTNSLDDGTYAVRFEETLCNEDDIAEVTASKSGFNEKTKSGVINKCDNGDCGGNYFTIINLGLEVKPDEPVNTGNSGGGSFRRKYYLCGNNKCDSGESATTCPKDCKVNTTAQTDTATANIELTNNGNSGNETTNLGDNNEYQSGLSRITGAVIGTLGTGWLIIIIFIIAVLVLSLIVKIIRKRKLNIEEI